MGSNERRSTESGGVAADGAGLGVSALIDEVEDETFAPAIEGSDEIRAWREAGALGEMGTAWPPTVVAELTTLELLLKAPESEVPGERLRLRVATDDVRLLLAYSAPATGS